MALEQVFKCPSTLNKLRTGPLAKLLEGFCQYINKRLKIAPHRPDSPLLLNERRRRLCYPTVNQTFRGLLQKCGIAQNKRTGPRIHDLRHSFAVHRLLAWYQLGYDVNAMLYGPKQLLRSKTT